MFRFLLNAPAGTAQLTLRVVAEWPHLTNRIAGACDAKNSSFDSYSLRNAGSWRFRPLGLKKPQKQWRECRIGKPDQSTVDQAMFHPA
jgi:hypothetical protein